jgi:hypothetical protein
MVSSSIIYKGRKTNYYSGDVNPSLIVRAGIFLSTFLTFSYYYYYYLPSVVFNEGISHGRPSFTTELKLILLFVTYFFYFDFSIRKIASLSEYILLFFGIFFLIYFIAVYFQEGWETLMFLNFFLIFIPLVLFRPRIKVLSIILFFEFGMWILVFQTLLDLWIFLNGYNLWLNKSFIGGFGNPSSFGITCNIFLLYTLYFRKINILTIFPITILFVGIIFSNSLLSYLLMFIILFYALIWRYLWTGVLIALPSTGLFYIIMDNYVIELSPHLAYKLNTLLGFLGSSMSFNIISSSVSNRINNYKNYLEILFENPGRLIFFGIPDNYYLGVDSQYLVYFGGFGVFMSLFFFITILLYAIKGMKQKGVQFLGGLILSLFLFIFIFNRILDYFPMALFFVLSLSLVKSSQLSIVSSSNDG